jgi:hypothetical protein
VFAGVITILDAFATIIAAPQKWTSCISTVPQVVVAMHWRVRHERHGSTLSHELKGSGGCMAAKAKGGTLKARLRKNQLTRADLNKIKALVKTAELATKALRGAMVE